MHELVVGVELVVGALTVHVLLIDGREVLTHGHYYGAEFFGGESAVPNSIKQGGECFFELGKTAPQSNGCSLLDVIASV